MKKPPLPLPKEFQNVQKDLRIKLWTTPSKSQTSKEQQEQVRYHWLLSAKSFTSTLYHYIHHQGRSDLKVVAKYVYEENELMQGRRNIRINYPQPGPNLPNFGGNRRKTYSFKRPWIWLTPPDFHTFWRHWNERYNQPTTTISPTQQSHFPSLTKYTGRTVKRL